jgi:hypothetical protein
VFFLVFAIVAATLSGVQGPAAAPQSGVRRVDTAIAPAESSLVGTIERFEEEARRLVLQTKDAHVPFILAPDAVVRLGSHTLAAADLAAHRGRRAKVRYTQVDGRRTAHWVVISSEPPRKLPEPQTSR